MVRECYSGVTVVLQRCYSGGIVMSQQRERLMATLQMGLVALVEVKELVGG